MSGGGVQLGLGIAPPPGVRLFSEHYLADRLPSTERYLSIDVEPFREELTSLWGREADTLVDAGEAQTEKRWIQPILELLGFEFIVQQEFKVGASLRRPDYALFVDADAHADARGRSGGEAYRHATAVADAKRFGRPLTGKGARGDGSADPETQIIQYVSLSGCHWGILTNGRLWRIYAAAGNLIEGACHQVDLVELLEGDDRESLRAFLAFFEAGAFRPGSDGFSFNDHALDQSETATEAVGGALVKQVFSAVPLIAAGLLVDSEPTRQNLDDAFANALVVLYRLLFCLQAEARGLLPVDNRHYLPYSLQAQRIALAGELDDGRKFSRHSDDLYNDLVALFRIVNLGDPDLGVNEYDGTLFASDSHPWLQNRRIGDDRLSIALDQLYRVDSSQIDYRDLSVRHLGTIYEQLLAFELAQAEDGDGLELVDSPRRKYTGSYFTPSIVVDRIVERTLDPVLERKGREVEKAGLQGEEALEEFLAIRVLDPAMGSGHFLVSVAAYIARHIVNHPSYVEAGTLDRLGVQRLVAERCIYGVDLIPMAVELAKLALWLTTVKGDEPLSYLGNLRSGDSLVGCNLAELLNEPGSLFAQQLAEEAERMLSSIGEIRTAQSHTADQVREKRRVEEVVRQLRKPLNARADQEVAPHFSEPRPLFHWELEFPEVFLDSSGRPLPEGGFDAIVGNPPYIRIQELGGDLASYCRANYEVAAGSFDAYTVFIERALSLLRSDGRLGFIVPNKLTKLEAAKKLRGMLVNEEVGIVEEVIDFGDAQLFEGATNYTCILVLDRGGVEELKFRKIPSGGAELRDALVSPDSVLSSSFQIGSLGTDAWQLVPPDERKVLDVMHAGAERLDEVAGSIFTGLQTSADPVYILEDRGWVGDRRRLYSKASDRIVELEPDLLHPLASGGDVEPWAFKPLNSVLLFPYAERKGSMELIGEEALAGLPATRAYLAEHEERLRGRERGKMDRDGWYGYVYPKSLAHHERPKLGVPRLCERLRASIDGEGGIYLDNVDVNGILSEAGGVDLPALLVLMNSNAVDWVFQRSSVPFRGNFLSANKQFIAPLPIHVPDTDQHRQLTSLGERLEAAASAVGRERDGFLRWLGGELEIRIDELAGRTKLVRPDGLPFDELVGILNGNRKLLVGRWNRSARERVEREHREMTTKIAESSRELAGRASEANEAVYDLYELDSATRSRIESEYPDSPRI